MLFGTQFNKHKRIKHIHNCTNSWMLKIKVKNRTESTKKTTHTHTKHRHGMQQYKWTQVFGKKAPPIFEKRMSTATTHAHVKHCERLFDNWIFLLFCCRLLKRHTTSPNTLLQFSTMRDRKKTTPYFACFQQPTAKHIYVSTIWMEYT